MLHHIAAIRALVTRLNIAGDRGRFADLAACFTADGELRWSTGGAKGRERIAAELGSATANPAIRFVRHHITTDEITFAPDLAAAEGRISFFVMSNAGPDHAGVYVDRYVREAEDWRVASREVVMEWQSPGSLYPRQATD